MKYTEHNYEYNYNNFKEWIQNIAALFIIAPLRLVSEISTKIVYLNRKLICSILNLSVIINAITLGLFCGIRIYLNSFDLWLGRTPIILQIVGLIILALIDVWYQLYDFAIYQHVNALLPILNRVITEDMQYFETNNEKIAEVDSKQEDSTKISYDELDTQILNELQDLESLNLDDLLTNDSVLSDLTNSLANQDVRYEKPLVPHDDLDIDENNTGKVSSNIKMENNSVDLPKSFNSVDLDELNDDLLSMLNEDLLEYDDLVEYRTGTELEINKMNSIETEELEKDMIESEENSKYVSEEHLFQFLKDLGADSFGTMQELDNLNFSTALEFD